MPTTPPATPDPVTLGLGLVDRLTGSFFASTPTTATSLGSSQASSGIDTLVLPGFPGGVDLIGDESVLSVKTGGDVTSKILFGVLVAAGTAVVITIIKRASR